MTLGVPGSAVAAIEVELVGDVLVPVAVPGPGISTSARESLNRRLAEAVARSEGFSTRACVAAGRDARCGAADSEAG